VNAATLAPIKPTITAFVTSVARSELRPSKISYTRFFTVIVFPHPTGVMVAGFSR
jgi:hypothetical protein